MKNAKENPEEKIEKATDVYPGAAIDKADSEEVDQALVKERVKTENNNPRSHDLF